MFLPQPTIIYAGKGFCPREELLDYTCAMPNSIRFFRITVHGNHLVVGLCFRHAISRFYMFHSPKHELIERTLVHDFDRFLRFFQYVLRKEALL